MFEAVINRLNAIKSLDISQVFDTIAQQEDVQNKIVELNKEQLLAGVGADGNSLPKYVDDPYFKTPQAALKYQAFKLHVSPNSSKDPAVMDFFINGQFHSTLKAEPIGNAFQIASDSDIAQDVQNKTGNEAIGLNADSIEELKPIFYDNAMEIIREKVFA